MKKRKNSGIIIESIDSYDLNKVFERWGIDTHLANFILAYLGSRSQETFTFKASSIRKFIELNVGDQKNIPSSREIAKSLKFLVKQGLVTIDRNKYPMRYKGRKFNVQEIKNIK
ncbi:MAG: hypothetical protein QXU98_01720 [Candidatus Parvarchaeota archaeon]